MEYIFWFFMLAPIFVFVSCAIVFYLKRNKKDNIFPSFFSILSILYLMLLLNEFSELGEEQYETMNTSKVEFNKYPESEKYLKEILLDNKVTWFEYIRLFSKQKDAETVKVSEERILENNRNTEISVLKVEYIKEQLKKQWGY